MFPFLCIWFFCFLIFLNMYPGTLSCDTPGQLKEAVELNSFSNLNPLINTFVVTVCVQIGMVFGTVNTGIAIYTFVQFTLYALVTAYVVYILYSKGFHVVFLTLATVYFVWPINLIYATGMWKDTFFAVFFLMTLVYSYAHIYDDHLKISNFITLSIFSFICSLARNSGWSSLGAGAVFLMIFGFRKHSDNRENTVLKIGTAQMIGVLTACFFILVVYPSAGISNTFSTIGKSIPLQQIARTVVDDKLTSEEIYEINYFGKSDCVVDEIPDHYSSRLVDGVRGLFDGELIEENPWRFNLLWIRLGIKHPTAYFHAVIDHTVCYWWPDTSSWLADNRIFENSYGVERDSRFLPGKDLAMALYRILTAVPWLNLLSNSGFTFWMILLCIYFCCMNQNSIGALLCVPIAMIYIGLIPVSYGALFRYTYAAVLSLPMLFGYAFMKDSVIVKRNNGKNKNTDWTEYYQKKKSVFSTFTQKFTLDKIIDCIDQSLCNEFGIMELGGGNSCFAERICSERKVSVYNIIDNNELSVDLFKKQKLNTDSHTGFLINLTDKCENAVPGYDFVYSIGLIEHFSAEDRDTVIQNHFRYCKPGGHIMISFPTPTKKYRFWRKIMECLNVWMFWDEIPLRFEDISRSLEQDGEIIKVELNNKLFLTQTIVLVRKKYEVEA